MTQVYGLDIQDAPTGWTALEVVVLVKALNAEGRVSMYTRTTDGLAAFEALGLLTAAQRSVSDDLARNLLDDDDPDYPDEAA